MKKLKWLLEIADQKPLLFSILLLIIAIGYLSDIAIHRDRDIDKCNEVNRKQQENFTKKLDENAAYYRVREAALNDEVKRTLSIVIDTYKEKLEEQRRLYERMDSTINENKHLLKTNKNRR